MEDFECEICFENYDDTKVVPKVLDCGHTICGSCIYNMDGFKPQCPSCRRPITKAKKYVTNYSLLSLLQQKKNIQMKGKTIEEEFSEIIEKLKNLQHSLTQNVVEPEQKLSQVMEECVNKLKDSKTGNETNVYSMVSAIAGDLAEKEKTSKRDLEIITQCLTLIEVQGDCEASECRTNTSPMKRVSEMKSDLSLRDFNDSVLYRKKIRERLRSREVYVAHPFENKILYGKLGLAHKTWQVSVLEAKEVPDGASIIELQDLKEAMKDYSICSFLEITDENDRNEGTTLMIDLKPSHLTQQFIKLCTGECGVSYKNSHLCEPIDLEDDDVEYMCVSKEPFEERPKGLSDYSLSQSFKFKYYEVIVRILNNGCLSIGQAVRHGSSENLVGVARKNDHIDMDDGWYASMKIEDCGIYFCPKESED